MDTLYIGSFGEFPAKKMIEVKVGDKVLISDMLMGEIKNIEYDKEMVRLLVIDNLTCVEFTVYKTKNQLIGVIPKR